MAANFHRCCNWIKVDWSFWWTSFPQTPPSTLTSTRYFDHTIDSALSHSPIAVYIPSVMRHQLQKGYSFCSLEQKNWQRLKLSPRYAKDETLRGIFYKCLHLSVALVINLKNTEILNYWDMRDRQIQQALKWEKKTTLDYPPFSYPSDCQN